MSRFRSTSHSISGVFIFLLLGIFAIFSTVMVLMGTKAYRGMVDRYDENNAARIASSYIRSMLRADDEAGTLRIETVDGLQTITMLNNYGDEDFVTRLYVSDGMLREWFTWASEPFVPEQGEAVCAADSLSAVWEDGLLTVTVSANGSETKIYYAPRSAAPEGGL